MIGKSSLSKSSQACCDGGKSCGSGKEVSRRTFLLATGAGIAAIEQTLPVMAGPFATENDYLKLITKDKKLDPNWVRSLFERGNKETYSTNQALRHIGMPVGGLFAGTVYLSGDGQLWLWDIFNQDQEGIAPRKVPFQGGEIRTRDGANYVAPASISQPFDVGFELQIGENNRNLDLSGFSDVTFDGRYPTGNVKYADDNCPVTAQLESFSPFIPLNVSDSSLPAVVMNYTICNTSDALVTGRLAGKLENAICLESRRTVSGEACNRIERDETTTSLVCTVEPLRSSAKMRPDIVFEEFEKATYEDWTVTGHAFGTGPIRVKDIAAYQGNVGGKGERVVNSHASAPGNDVKLKDSQTGKLLSPSFTIKRNFIHFLIGGGNHADQTFLNVLVEDKRVATATGENNNRMRAAVFDVRNLQGKEAKIEIVDSATGGWGNVGVDHIVFSDRESNSSLEQQRDFGSMSMTLLDKQNDDQATASIGDDKLFAKPVAEATRPFGSQITGAVGRHFRLRPGEQTTVTFVIAWHFPNFYSRGVGGALVGHHYASRFPSAAAVARYIAREFERLASATREWVATWYDSTLPYWLLDRTMANTSTLATATCYRFRDGRFWAWEGIGCCPGTCTHVWHYAQAPARLFPEVERIERERVNFGLGLHPDGGVGMRAGLSGSNEAAHDGQCGRILGVLREHQMSDDDKFLRRLWPKVKRAIAFLIRQDVNDDGMIEGSQPNTLDASWFGKISFLSSLYLAALRAGDVMATEMGDHAFATRCKTIAQRGAESILETYNGEYFIQVEDQKYRDKIGIGSGCYIDQIFGQTWAHWVGLGQLFDRNKQLSALRALWNYNFVPDVGPFRKRFKRGRWYASAGDAGLLMCTWPKGGKRDDWEKHWQYMYFNECMSGFEWQAAANMAWEGHDQPDLLEKGLAVSRAIHDRYNAQLRNPYNEIECSDHYARAMASYGVFQAVCGFNCHAPQGHIAFEPRLSPDDFRCAFVGSAGWGTFHQSRGKKAMQATFKVRHGKLRLRSIQLTPQSVAAVGSVNVTVGEKPVPASLTSQDPHVTIELDRDVELQSGESLEISLS